MQTYLSSAYLAPIQYYFEILKSQRVYIDIYENYQKQSFRNRCSILSANGAMPLSIPVEHASGEKVLMKDIRIATHGNWQHLHWNAIVSAYNSTPFFEYYQDDFYPFYHHKYSFLLDFNESLQNMILKILHIDTFISNSDEYKKSFSTNELDLRNTIHPKKNWREVDPSFHPTEYYQIFGDRFGFIENLSIIDLLFNMGNESVLVLNDCLRKDVTLY